MRVPLLATLFACAVASAYVGIAKADDTSGHLTRQQMIFESSRLDKLNVYNDQNVKLGSLNNTIIDSHNGQVFYGVVHTGVGGRDVLVPWNAFRIEKRGARKLRSDYRGDLLVTVRVYNPRRVSPEMRSQNS